MSTSVAKVFAERVISPPPARPVRVISGFIRPEQAPRVFDRASISLKPRVGFWNVVFMSLLPLIFSVPLLVADRIAAGYLGRARAKNLTLSSVAEAKAKKTTAAVIDRKIRSWHTPYIAAILTGAALLWVTNTLTLLTGLLLAGVVYGIRWALLRPRKEG